jgi:glycosyltransferase involved in cell wall biosynthesis
LVYGEWEGSSKNIKPFFTATYTEDDKAAIAKRNLKNSINFVFVGALVAGKNPLYAIQLIEQLAQKGHQVRLTLFGEGKERQLLEQYCSVNNLENWIVLKGNQTKDSIQKAYQDSHFVILPSQSEGWPKVIAEGMFWGCVPVATKVSCVPFMLDYGSRGLMLEMDLEKDVVQLESVLDNQILFDTMQKKGAEWSRKYTVDIFEEEVKKLLLGS